MIKLIPLILILGGCSAKPVAHTPVVEVPIFHPTLPAPYEVCNITWELIEVNGRVKVAVSFDENVTAAVCFKDLERYLSQLGTVVCYYRKNLEDNICIKDTNDSN